MLKPSITLSSLRLFRTEHLLRLALTSFGALLLSACSNDQLPDVYLGEVVPTAYQPPPVFVPADAGVTPKPTDGGGQSGPALAVTPCSNQSTLVVKNTPLERALQAVAGSSTQFYLASATTVYRSDWEQACPASVPAAVFDSQIGAIRAMTMVQERLVMAGESTVATFNPDDGALLAFCVDGIVRQLSNDPNTADRVWGTNGGNSLYSIVLSNQGSTCTQVEQSLNLGTAVWSISGSVTFGSLWFGLSTGTANTTLTVEKRSTSDGSLIPNLPVVPQSGSLCSVDQILELQSGKVLAILDSTCSQVSIIDATSGQTISTAKWNSKVIPRALSAVPTSNSEVLITLAESQGSDTVLSFSTATIPQ
jgi:hypothetical protein